MKSRIVYNGEDQNLLQTAVDLIRLIGTRDISYDSNSNYANADKLLRDCLEQHVSNLVVFELTLFGDRLDRIIKTLSMFFKSAIQVDLYSNGELISLDSFSCFSEEVLLILFKNLGSVHKTKIKNGQSVAKLNGKKIGRASYISTNLIKGMRDEGMSIREISHTTGISITSVWRHTRDLADIKFIPEAGIEN